MKNAWQKNISLLLFMAFSTLMIAQSNSQYSVRFNLGEVDCVNQLVYIDLEVKAEPNFPMFYISDQNYRFSFKDQEVINPRIVQELEISGSTYDGASGYIAFFDPHHLGGSLDTIVSYNVVLTGGTGYPIDDTRWYPVGRIGFDIVDMDACLELKWHTQDPFDFPNTFIGEKFGGLHGSLHSLAEGSYDNGGPNNSPKVGNITCFQDACNPIPVPIELADFYAEEDGCNTKLIWETETETDNDYFLVEKSNDGTEWITIGKIPGAGTTVEPQSYSYVDKAIVRSLTYYRLKQVDIDLQSSTTNSLVVRSPCFNDEMEIGITEIFPNPVKNNDRVTIVVYSRNNTESYLTVTDATGRVVVGLKQDLIDGRNVLSFKGGNLAPGVYFVKVTGNGWYSITRKFVKVIGD